FLFRRQDKRERHDDRQQYAGAQPAPAARRGDRRALLGLAARRGLRLRPFLGVPAALALALGARFRLATRLGEPRRLRIRRRAGFRGCSRRGLCLLQFLRALQGRQLSRGTRLGLAPQNVLGQPAFPRQLELLGFGTLAFGVRDSGRRRWRRRRGRGARLQAVLLALPRIQRRVGLGFEAFALFDDALALLLRALQLVENIAHGGEYKPLRAASRAVTAASCSSAGASTPAARAKAQGIARMASTSIGRPSS